MREREAAGETGYGRERGCGRERLREREREVAGERGCRGGGGCGREAAGEGGVDNGIFVFHIRGTIRSGGGGGGRGTKKLQKSVPWNSSFHPF